MLLDLDFIFEKLRQLFALGKHAYWNIIDGKK